MSNRKVLCVDLDGTLLKNDISRHALCCFLKKKPWYFFKILKLACHGSLAVKQELSKRVPLPPGPYIWNLHVINYIVKMKSEGCYVCLATGAPQAYAQQLIQQLPVVFDDCFGSNNSNLVGKNKARFLKDRFGSFIYIGNSWQDRFVFNLADEIIAVTTSTSLIKWIKKQNKPYTIFPYFKSKAPGF